MIYYTMTCCDTQYYNIYTEVGSIGAPPSILVQGPRAAPACAPRGAGMLRLCLSLLAAAATLGG